MSLKTQYHTSGQVTRKQMSCEKITSIHTLVHCFHFSFINTIRYTPGVNHCLTYICITTKLCTYNFCLKDKNRNLIKAYQRQRYIFAYNMEYIYTLYIADKNETIVFLCRMFCERKISFTHLHNVKQNM